MPIVKENPTYFTDQVRPMDPEYYANESSIRRNNAFQSESISVSRNTQQKSPIFPPRQKPPRRGPLSSTDDSELEVFLSSGESNNSSTFSYSENGNYGMNNQNRKVGVGDFNKLPITSPLEIEEGKKSLGFGQKLGQFFWKSKSKQSIGTGSGSDSGSTSGIGSSSYRCTDTPDSSLSICTSSLESSHSSNFTNSSLSPLPKSFSVVSKEGNVTLINDQTALYRFDDCERYAANMYYNMMGIEGGGDTTYTLRMKPRNNSVPLEASGKMNETEDCVQPYYNNTTFSTFPNPRRHSIAYSSAGSNDGRGGGGGRRTRKDLTMVNNKETVKQDRDGYLRPNEPRNLRNGKNSYYINEPGRSNNFGSVQVQVDVHTPSPKSPSLLGPSSSSIEDCFEGETSGTTFTTTDDSQASTVVPFYNKRVVVGASGSSSYGYYKRGASSSGDSLLGSTSELIKKGGRDARVNNLDRVHHPMYMNRIGNDCEPYCSLCASAAMLPSNSKKTKMDVAIVSCQECFFSKETEFQIRTFFDKLITSDKQKLDVALQSYDLKDLDRSNVKTNVHRSKVQIVIISQTFLTRLKAEASTRVRLSPVNRVFRSKRVIAVLYGVSAKEICEEYEGVLARFSEWFCVELRCTSKLDPEFCKKFTEQVVKIYNVELSNTSNFSVFPKKVTKEQGKIVLSLKKPTEPEDHVRVEFTCGRKSENIPKVKMENPYQSLIRVPVNLSPDRTALIEVAVYVNDHKLGATWVKSELQRLGDDDPIERMGNMVPGFSNVLDEHISQTLSKNFRDCIDYVTDPTIEIMTDVLVCKGDEFPTVMHFAAYYGLEHTAYTVLHEADGLEQCRVSNEMEERPLDIAKKRDYESVIKLIEDFQDINESYIAVQYIKDLVGKMSMISMEDIKVHKMNKPNEIEVTYENVDAAIKKEEENLKQLKNHNVSTSSEIEDLPSNSAGSYVNLPDEPEVEKVGLKEDLDGEAGYSEIPELPQMNNNEEYIVISKESKVQKPIPQARTPKKNPPKDYTNIDLETRAQENPEEVQRRIKKTSTVNKGNDSKRHSISPSIYDQVNRRKISPMTNPYYDQPRDQNNDYQYPPPGTRPVTPPHQRETFENEEDLAQKSPVFQIKVKGSIPTEQGYLIMNLDESGSTAVAVQAGSLEETFTLERKQSFTCHEEGYPNNLISKEAMKTKVVERYVSKTRELSSPTPSYSSHSSVKMNNNKEFQKNKSLIDKESIDLYLDPTDQELIQLMEDFKSSGYPMQQIELLFENWKTRPDVQESFEKKKENLKKIRDEYKRIQQITSPNVKSKPFLEKLKSILTGRKKSNASMLSPSNNVDLTGNKSENQFFVPQDEIFRIKSKSQSSDRESFGSHGSGGGGDSGVSEVGSDKANDSLNSNSKQPAVCWGDPLSKRFHSSYISPDSNGFNTVPPIIAPVAGIEDFSVSNPDLNSSYDVPPAPRPFPQAVDISTSSLTGITNCSPPLPQKPSKEQSPLLSKIIPPPPPQKPSHMKHNINNNFNDHNGGNPPPPPPRSYKPPNVFNYIDYSKKD